MQANSPQPRVLVIDDNTDIHADFQKILCTASEVDQEFDEMESLFGNPVTPTHAATNVDIEFASQGAEGYEKVKQSLADGNPFSLAFVDIRMPPGWDGVETTKRIWELDPEIQVVICSAFSDFSWHEMACELKHSDRFLVLKKPFESIEVRQLVAALHHRWFGARSDALTGLMNRRAFLKHFKRQCSPSRQEARPFSCAMLDLDFFKHVNDVHGHPSGDAVLKAVAETLQEQCRKGDHVARFGGEEFCVLLKASTEETAKEWCETALEAIRKLKIQIDDDTCLSLTASFGVAEVPSGIDPQEGMKRADMALLFAKQSGRNRVCKYSQLTSESKSELPNGENSPFHGVTARKIMTPINTISRDATLNSAARILVRDNLSSAPVVDSEGQLVGVLSESDLLPRILDDNLLQRTTSHQVMQTSVIYFQEETPLHEIYEFLIRVAIPQVVIVRDHRPVGVIARATLLDWLCSIGYPVTTRVGETLSDPPVNMPSAG